MRIVGWLAPLAGVTTAWFGAWIYLPAPTYFLMPFSVGGPEVSHWTILVALIGATLSVTALGDSPLARLALGLNLVAIILAAGVWLRVPGTLKRFEASTRSRMATPNSPRRAKPVVFADLWRGVSLGDARITRGVVVKEVEGERLTADIYAPTRHALFPIVVQIYGGAWRAGEPSDFSNFATWLASSGYVVVAIDYRHAPKHRWPAQIDDVDDALRWVVAHATDYDGDTSRVVLIGRSAGAHLATYAAWITAPIHLRGVISLYGPADLVTSYQHPPRPDPIHVREVEESLIGGPLSTHATQYANASTITHLPRLGRATPPSLLIYGRRDHIVEAKYGSGLQAALTATGGEVSYLELPWADHAFDEVFNGPSGQITLYYTERFLARVMAP